MFTPFTICWVSRRRRNWINFESDSRSHLIPYVWKWEYELLLAQSDENPNYFLSVWLQRRSKKSKSIPLIHCHSPFRMSSDCRWHLDDDQKFSARHPARTNQRGKLVQSLCRHFEFIIISVWFGFFFSCKSRAHGCMNRISIGYSKDQYLRVSSRIPYSWYASCGYGSLFHSTYHNNNNGYI